MIETIARLDDPRVADYALVGNPTALRERGLFVAEGRLVVRRLIEAATFNVRSVLVTPAALSSLTAVLESRSFAAYVCEQQTMNALAGFNFHRGCLAIAERPVHDAPLDRFAHGHRLLALEGVNNPDNVGGLFRVAAAFGAAGVLLDRSSGDPLYRKAIRTSMGASLRVPFSTQDDWIGALRGLQRGGAALLALTPRSSATPLSSFARELPSGRRFVLMLGAEGPGLSDDALRAADVTVRIPIAADVDSLNVVVAAGIAMAALDGR